MAGGGLAAGGAWGDKGGESVQVCPESRECPWSVSGVCLAPVGAAQAPGRTAAGSAGGRMAGRACRSAMAGRLPAPLLPPPPAASVPFAPARRSNLREKIMQAKVAYEAASEVDLSGGARANVERSARRPPTHAPAHAQGLALGFGRCGLGLGLRRWAKIVRTAAENGAAQTVRTAAETRPRRANSY